MSKFAIIYLKTRMKKLVFVSMTFLFILAVTQLRAKSAVDKGVITRESKSISSSFKEIESNKVSSSTIRKFNQDFGALSNVVWEKSKSLSKAAFILNGCRMTAYYNSNAKLVGTTSSKSVADMPDLAQSKLKSMYKDYSIVSVVLFDNDGTNKAEILKNGRVFQNGNFLVSLAKGSKTIIVRLEVVGETYYFNQI